MNVTRDAIYGKRPDPATGRRGRIALALATINRRIGLKSLEALKLPRLAIARDFLGEYSKLEKKVQSAVEAAIGKFEAHTYAGLHLEKIHNSRDDRIRTIRVDAFWRGVVLAPDSGDTYCLVTVMPHDKAVAY